LRAIRQLTDAAFAGRSPQFDRLYSTIARPSIPPQQLLRASLVQTLNTIRSERLLMEEIDYSILFRWFVGLGLDEPIWLPTTFLKNLDRLVEGDVAAAFFDAVRHRAAGAGLLSDGHLIVDGAQLEAWASLTSNRRTTRAIPTWISAASGAPTGRTRRRPIRMRSLYRKPTARKACEREAAEIMLLAGRRPRTLAADKNDDVASFVATLRAAGITPHVAQKARCTAIDGRTTRQPGYHRSQRKRKLVEQAVGWMKTVVVLRKLRHRGGELVDWMLTFTATAYNLVRVRTIGATC